MVHEQLLCSAVAKDGASQPLSCMRINHPGKVSKNRVPGPQPQKLR